MTLFAQLDKNGNFNTKKSIIETLPYCEETYIIDDTSQIDDSLEWSDYTVATNLFSHLFGDVVKWNQVTDFHIDLENFILTNEFIEQPIETMVWDGQSETAETYTLTDTQSWDETVDGDIMLDYLFNHDQTLHVSPSTFSIDDNSKFYLKGTLSENVL